MDKFKRLGIIQPILRVIEEERFEQPTEIQVKAIPLVLTDKDVIAGSATGSGKTLVFGSDIIQNIKGGNGIQALILTPTRELAQQVSKALKKFSKYKPLNVACVYGGVSINPQIHALRRADVVVGTPGRILDHIQRKTIYLGKVKILVLDEADRMLDMGFIDDVEKIIRQCPHERQTLLFSATITNAVDRLSKRYMNRPAKVSAELHVDPSKLSQVYYNVQDNMKFSLLVHLLKHEDADLVIVFCNTRKNTDFVEKNLKLNGVNALAIHGGFSQDRRDKAISDFHSKNIHVLVCTDVAARGLDISGISHVYNYDIPKDSKDYIHRIGRTARAGKGGKAINVLAKRDWDHFARVIRENNLDISKENTPPIKRATIGWKEQPRRRGNFRRGGSGHRGPSRGGQHRGRSTQGQKRSYRSNRR
jgi:ATP-dependent RNA helicase DeaD